MQLVPDYKEMLVTVILDRLRDMREAGMEITKDSIAICLHSYHMNETEGLELSEELLDNYEAFKEFMGSDLPPWEGRSEAWRKLPSYVNSFLMGVYDLSGHVGKDEDYGLEVVEAVLEEINKMTKEGIDVTTESVARSLSGYISRYYGSYRIDERKKMKICVEISDGYEFLKKSMGADSPPWRERREDWEKLPFYVNSFLHKVYYLLKNSNEYSDNESEYVSTKEKIEGYFSSGKSEGMEKTSRWLEPVVGVTVLCLIGFGVAKLEESRRGLAGEFLLYLIGAVLAFFSAKFLLGDGIGGVIDRGGRVLRGGLVLFVIIVGLGMLTHCVSDGSGEFCVYKVGCI